MGVNKASKPMLPSVGVPTTSHNPSVSTSPTAWPAVRMPLSSTAEIAAVIADGAFYHLDAPVKRIGAMDVPIPFSPVLEDLTVPNEKAVVEAAKALCRKS